MYDVLWLKTLKFSNEFAGSLISGFFCFFFLLFFRCGLLVVVSSCEICAVSLMYVL